MSTPGPSDGAISAARPVDRAIPALLVGCLAALAVAVLVLASVPPVDRDALTHHLVVPKLYLQHGGMVEIPWIPFSYYPMNLDLIYLLPLRLGFDVAAKYIHFGFGLLTAGVIFGYLRGRTKSRAWALLGSLLFLSLPVVVKLSITVYVDLGLVFFSTAALVLLMRWASADGRLRHLAAAGVLCGLAMGTKYNGLLTFFLLACFVPLLAVRRGRAAAGPGSSGRALAAGVLFAATALIVFAPWMIRNYAWTGNPVYPLYQGLFAGARGGAAADAAASPEDEGAPRGMDHLTARRVVFEESLLETLAIPLRIFFQGEDDSPRYFDGRLNPWLLLFALAAFVGARSRPPQFRREDALMAAFAALYVLFAFVQTDMRIRYVAPILGPMAILATLGIRNAAGLVRNRLRPSWAHAFALGALVVFLAPNLSYIAAQFRSVQPIDYLSGRVSRDDYIQRFRPEFATYRYINAHLPDDARVLGVYMGNRRYYCDRVLISDGTLEAGFRLPASAEALAGLVRSKGCSHIVLRADLFERFVLQGAPPPAAAVLQAFVSRHTRTLFVQDGYVLLALEE